MAWLWRYLGLWLALGSLLACGPMPPIDPFNLAEAKDNLNKGHLWYLRGCHREAARFFEEGLTFARLADNVPLMVMGQNSLGTALLAQGQLKEAAQRLAAALELSLATPDNPELDSVLGNLGTLAYKTGRNRDAEDFWREALDRAPEPRKATYLANLARLYLTEKKPDAFAAHTEMALAAAKNPLTPPAARADALALGATLAQSRGETEPAWIYLNEALDLDRQLENPVGLAQDLELAAKMELAAGQTRQAAQSLDRAFYLWAALGNREGMSRTYAGLGQTHQNGHPQDLASYQKILAHPASFDPLGQGCP
ncbi:MAG: tetratricopeptide repeat protein [Deltaproteobacteria bacterium]|jgi:tetratricopeptide (TPR) repeat protein|nr:tetratricopeptide repeat protein [Deltaproteobacteria bacterium]